MASDLQPKRSLALQPSLAVTTAKTVIGEEVAIPPGVDQLVVQAIMTYGSSGTAIKVYVQTSLDNGVTWVDVICITFATTTATKVSAVRKANRAGGLLHADGRHPRRRLHQGRPVRRPDADEDRLHRHVRGLDDR